MMLFMPFVLTTVLSFTTATPHRHAYPQPFNTGRSSLVREQVGLLGPSRVPRITPRILPRLPPSKSVVWVKRLDPRTGAWVKVIKGKRNVISPEVRHHFANKAHIVRKMRMANIVRARNLARMNTIRGGLLAVAWQRNGDYFPRVSARPLSQRRGGGYRKQNRMIKIRPRAGTVGILGQGIDRRPMPFIPLRNSRRPLLRRNINVRRRFDDDNNIFDDPIDSDFNDFEDFGEIDDSFDDRFDQGFRDTYPLLNSRSNSVLAGVRGAQISEPLKPVPKSRNPSIKGDVAGFPRKDYYSKMNSIPRRDINTVGIGSTQSGGSFKPSDNIRNNINAAILGTFDRKRKYPFLGRRGEGDAGILGSQRNGFDVSTPGNIGVPNTGIIGLAGDDQLPDGLLDDFGHVEDLNRLDNRLDLVTDELRHLNDRLDRNERLDLNDRLDLDDRLNDQIDLENRLENRFTQFAPVQRRNNNDIIDKPHIAKAIDEFERDRVDVEGDIGLLDQDRSPIDGLELLGPSSWSDIITEINNAVARNHIFDQEPRESVPVFPVNPHSAAEPKSSDESEDMENRNNGLGEGSLALLGIDPGTIATTADHPPPIPIPEKSVTTVTKNSQDSLRTTKTVAIAGSDDSTRTVITVETSKNDIIPGSNPSSSGTGGRTPTKDILSAAEQMAMLGNLDNMDFGTDGFDNDLRI